MDEQTYLNGNGKRQSAYTEEWNELVPASGKAGTLQGEVLRAASHLYYSWFNDGEHISSGVGHLVDSSAERAWCFLGEAVKLMPGSKLLELVCDLTADVTCEEDGPSYAAALELLLDAAVAFAGIRPLVPTDSDFCDRKWRDNYLKASGLDIYENDKN